MPLEEGQAFLEMVIVNQVQQLVLLLQPLAVCVRQELAGQLAEHKLLGHLKALVLMEFIVVQQQELALPAIWLWRFQLPFWQPLQFISCG